MLYGTNVESIAVLQGSKGRVSEELRLWNSSIIRNKESNCKTIHFERSTKLDMQDIQGPKEVM